MDLGSFRNYLKAAHPLDILRQLDEHRIQNPEQEILIEVHDQSGISFRGNFLQLREDSRGQIFLILSADENGVDLTFCLAHTLVAVKVFKADLYKAALSFKTYPTQLDLEKKTSLQAKREIAQLAYPAPLNIRWELFQNEESVPGALVFFCQELAAAFDRITEDDLGKSAVARIKEVEILPVEAGVSLLLKGTKLSIALDLNSIPDRNKIAKDLSQIL